MSSIENDLGFAYTLKRKGLLTGLKIVVRADGEVIVTAPKILSVNMIEKELRAKKEWIKKCLVKNSGRQKNTPEAVFIFGKNYQKRWGDWPEEKLGVMIKGDQVWINGPKLTAARAEEKLEDFLKLTAEKYIRRRVPQLAAIMNLAGAYRRITLKKQSTRWGSCSSDKNLNFNWTLVYYEPAVIDYVLIHELAHLIHMNHSEQFWEVVAEYDRAYKKHRRVLNG